MMETETGQGRRCTGGDISRPEGTLTEQHLQKWLPDLTINQHHARGPLVPCSTHTGPAGGSSGQTCGGSTWMN